VVDEPSSAGDGKEKKELLGIPYDWRRPTAERVRSRMWNPEDRRLFPPKAYGWGWTVNFYWFVHPWRRRPRRHEPPTT
jgi:hypothetical protein